MHIWQVASGILLRISALSPTIMAESPHVGLVMAVKSTSETAEFRTRTRESPTRAYWIILMRPCHAFRVQFCSLAGR